MINYNITYYYIIHSHPRSAPAKRALGPTWCLVFLLASSSRKRAYMQV